MPFTTRKLDANRRSGIIVEGLVESDLADQAICGELQKLLIEHGIINFVGSQSASFHVALSKVFGDLAPHPNEGLRSTENPDLACLRFDPGSGELWEVDGRVLGAWLPWHFDHHHVAEVNRGGILRAVTLPRSGGDTWFVDKIEAYDALPEHLKNAIENLHVVYTYSRDYAKHRYLPKINAMRMVRSSHAFNDKDANGVELFPPVVHPIVFRQPETGRAMLNISPANANYIYEMNEDKGHELLEKLIMHITSERFVYKKKWALDEMLLWDNWRMLHAASGVEPTDSREMIRTTIMGDYGVGKNLAEFSIATAE